MHNEPMTPATGQTPARRAVRFGLALALLLLLPPPSSALPQVVGPGPGVMVKFTVDLFGFGDAGMQANSQGIDTCFEFDGTGQRLNVDVSSSGVMVYSPFLGEGGDPEFKPELPPVVTSAGSPILGDAPLPLLPNVPLGPFEVNGKRYGWGTQEAGYSTSGCP